MAKGMSGIVSPAANIAADETDPQISIRAADAAFVEAGVFSQARAAIGSFSETEFVLGVTAYRTA